MGVVDLASLAVLSGFRTACSLGVPCAGTRLLFSVTNSLVPSVVAVAPARWFFLWALDLVEVRGSRSGGETSVSRGCSVSLVVTPGCPFLTSWRSRMLRVCAEGCFRIVFDSVGSTGVVSGPTLVVGRGITMFRCFVSSLLPLSLEFLLLWLVRNWLSLLSLVHEANPPTLFSFPAEFKCELQESVAAIAGCACYKRGCWFAHAAVEFVVSLRIRGCVLRVGRRCPCLVGCPLVVGVSTVLVVCLASRACALLCAVLCSVGVFARAKKMLVCRVAPLVERCYTCLWLLSALCWLVVNSGELLPEFFSVDSSGSESSLLPLLLEFLLLWLGLAVAGVHFRTVVVAVCMPCVASSVSCEHFSRLVGLRVSPL
ncbi:hypothetical protein Taro_048206 [Colocasia esculenta]|uniref:Uncharacterized protein n=1 Tax=Colocasia esculenta TaxID=4460 RepID=A0A843X7Q6_COLES|nr:hypothetical protein [Colocasia esculenta]